MFPRRCKTATPQHPPCYPIKAIVDLGKNRKPRLVTQVKRTRSHYILYVLLVAVPLVGIIVQLKEGQALPIFGIWDVVSPWPRDHEVAESILESHEMNLHCKKFRPLMGTPAAMNFARLWSDRGRVPGSCRIARSDLPLDRKHIIWCWPKLLEQRLLFL